MVQRLLNAFSQRYGTGAKVYSAPARINLIGEHTDYNGGFVLPAAINRSLCLAIRPKSVGTTSSVWALDYEQGCEFDPREELPEPLWARFVYGVVCEMRRRGVEVPPFEAVFCGDIPSGAGLSASAALTSLFAYALNDLSAGRLTPVELAKVGQSTEHRYMGVRCGIMDQMISLLGEEDRVMRLDCRRLEYEMLPFKPEGYRLLLIDSMVTHSLAATEYNIRRGQCERGVAVIARHVSRVSMLRDVGLDMLDAYRSEMDEWVYRRCRYVIEENQRLLYACRMLTEGDYEGFGQKMFESHEGLSKEYGVSCDELDFIQRIARETPGVIGACMMGGGFGGCVLCLVREESVAPLTAAVEGRFDKRFGMRPHTIDVQITRGVHRME